MNETTTILIVVAIIILFINLIMSIAKSLNFNNSIDYKIEENFNKNIGDLLDEKINDLLSTYPVNKKSELFQRELALKIRELFLRECREYLNDGKYDISEIHEYVEEHYNLKKEDEKFKKIYADIYKLDDINSIEKMEGVLELHKRDFLKKEANEFY